MIRSMTGYGSAEKLSAKYHIKVELKSLNGKFLELNLRSPKTLGDKEALLRKHLSKKLIRGSVLCILTMDRIDDSGEGIQLNKGLAKYYFNQMKALADELQTNDDDILRTVLTMPDVLKAEEGSIEDSDWQDVLAAVEEAFEKFEQFRLTEGDELGKMLEGHNEAILAQLPKIEALEAERKALVKERLLNGLEDLNKEGKTDANRFEQEMIYYLEKLDIAEEKNRLVAHCQLFAKELKKEANGKKLGFIGQEMGREINTLGSKAGFAPIQELVIAMKEELEKIKEQALNVL